MMTTLPARRAIVGMVLFLQLLAMASGTRATGEANGVASWTADYPVPGSPYQVAVEAPNRVWATLPAENAIIRLTLTSSVPDVGVFVLPVANSEPYDIAFAAGRIWFTERSGNRIGSLDAASDPATSAWTEYPIENTPNCEPTGITVVAGDPVEVWFAKRAGNKLGRLRVSDMGSATIYYFRPPSPRDQPQVFEHMSTGSGSQPWDIEVGPDGAPWFIEPHSNRVGNYTPGTLTYFTWYELPVSSSTPYCLDVAQGLPGSPRRMEIAPASCSH